LPRRTRNTNTSERRRIIARRPLRRHLRARLALRRLLRNGERLIVPPTSAASVSGARRALTTSAASWRSSLLVAVGFFGPSLVMARVPPELWLPFASMACVAAVVIAGSFFVIGRRTTVAAGFAFFDACLVAILSWMFRDYYHQIGLLFTLLVAGFAVVHGFRASLEQ
jgi:hypothetical protein